MCRTAVDKKSILILRSHSCLMDSQLRSENIRYYSNFLVVIVGSWQRQRRGGSSQGHHHRLSTSCRPCELHFPAFSIMVFVIFHDNVSLSNTLKNRPVSSKIVPGFIFSGKLLLNFH
ncbi:hypothetical protein AVEN_183319-1 [Araneus ventricosus]|uniref:Uncharacterized protein n=1 Tax=Araneus ventricosus TaxID=182803 RepID=A0A4Y2N5Q8_ARAVE|nr:hypothetical protein AVEN_183319-1 [Araneus ventricosus]